MKFHRTIIAALVVFAAACSDAPQSLTLNQAPEDLVAGEVMAVAYSGFREGPNGWVSKIQFVPAGSEVQPAWILVVVVLKGFADE